MQIVDHSYIVARRWYLLTVDIANKCQGSAGLFARQWDGGIFGPWEADDSS